MSDNSKTAICTEVDGKSVFTIDKKVLTLMDSVVEECECTGKACNRITENSYSGIEPHEWQSSSNDQAYGSPKLQKDKK